MKPENTKTKFNKPLANKAASLKTNDKTKNFEPKNTILTIEKLGNDFEGVAYVKGKRCLVNGTLPTETVSVSEPKNSGNVIVYKLDDIIKKSPLRVDNRCKYSSECGACSFDYVSDETQRKLKPT